MHNMQQRAQLAAYSELACCMALQVVVTDSIVVHLHHDIATVSQNLCRHHSSNILCCEVNMHSAATYESQVRHHH